MSDAPSTSNYILVSPDTVNLPNSQVLFCDPNSNLQLVSGGPGGNYTLSVNKNLASLTNVASAGLISYITPGQAFTTRFLASDPTITILNPDGNNGNPIFSVNPETTVQMLNFAFEGQLVSTRPTLNIIQGYNATINITDNGIHNWVDMTISGPSGPGSGTVTSVGLTSTGNTAIISSTGPGMQNPITADGTFNIEVPNWSSVNATGNPSLANHGIDNATYLSFPGGDGYSLIAGTSLTPSLQIRNNTTSSVGTLFDTVLNPALALSGGTMLGNLILNADPTVALQAATKQYVDSIASGLNVLPPCTLATTADLGSITYNNGAAGVGATITYNTTGVVEIDLIKIVLNDIILVKDQTNSYQNGIYKVTTEGNTGIAAVLTRTTYYDSAADVNPGDYTLVLDGDTNLNTGWIETATVSAIGIGNPIIFTQFNSAANIIAGTGLTKTGNTISLIAPVTIALGGTNAITRQPAFNNLSPLMVTGDTLYFDGTNNVSRGIGSTGQVYTVAGGVPTWSFTTGITGLSTVTSGTWNATPISTLYGGTGLTSIGSAGAVLANVAGSLAYSTVTGITAVGTIATGVWNGTAISTSFGGTGATSASAGFNNLSPMTTAGDMIYGGTLGAGTRLAIGSSGQVLSVSGGIPTWSSISSVLPATATGGLIVGSGVNTYTNLAIGTSGQILEVTGGTAVWSDTLTGKTMTTSTINSTTIGATTPSSGVFTALSVNASIDIPVLVQTSFATATNVARFFSSGVTAGNRAAIVHGVAGSTNNSAVIGFQYAGSGSTSNRLDLGFWGNESLFQLSATGNVSMGTITAGTWNGTTIAVANGGTGQTSASAAFNALAPATSTGGLILATGSNTYGNLAIGSNGTVLTSNGTTASWAAAAGGLATYIVKTSTNAPVNAQVLASLSTGLMKNTTTTGVVSIATAGTDYYSAGNPTYLYVPAFASLGVGVGSANSGTLSGGGCTAIGYQALNSSTSAADQTAVGANALQLATGGANTALGSNAGNSISTGTGNTTLGYYAATTVTTGTNNTLLGTQANVSAAGASNRIGIGYQVNVAADNTAQIGTAHGLFLGNYSGTPGTPSGGGILYISSGALYYKGSSGSVTMIASA